MIKAGSDAVGHKLVPIPLTSIQTDISHRRPLWISVSEIQAEGLDRFGNMFYPPDVPNHNVLPRIKIRPVAYPGVAGAVFSREET
jgi:hypothetical protein